MTRDYDVPTPGTHDNDRYRDQWISERDGIARIQRCGSHYFDDETMRCFNARFDGVFVPCEPKKEDYRSCNQYAITDSIRHASDPREYRVTVITFYPTGERYQTEYCVIDNVARFATKRAADKHRDQLAADLIAERA